MEELNYRKLLVIVYYWPPSGGSGVQRWVKLTKYLAKMGIQVFVLTVDENHASYLQLDPSLNDEVSPEIKIVKTPSFEIIKIFAALFGRKQVPTAGFYNLNKKSLIHNIGLIIRSNLFIPDPRRGWNYFAYKKAVQIIKNEGIKQVITSSPPHSTQLIGLKLKKKYNIEWTADLRDPWTDIFYYPILKHSALSKNIDKHYERSVLIRADHIFTISQNLKEILLRKDNKIDPEKVEIIPNGFDEDDFKNVTENQEKSDFVIRYTGTITEQYEPWGFLQAYQNFVKQSSGKIMFEITGTVAPSIIRYIEQLGINEYIKINPSIPHKEIPSLLVNSNVLLLMIPKVKHADLILTGKLFEYLASRRPVILIGPENGNAADILKECQAGSTYEWEKETEITQHLILLKSQHNNHLCTRPENRHINKYSRKNQANKIIETLFP